MSKLIIETRRKAPRTEPTPWVIAPQTKPDGYPTFAEARADVLDALQRAGFYDYANCWLLVDDLDPAKWRGEPDDNVLTTDEGQEIRVREACEL